MNLLSYRDYSSSIHTQLKNVRKVILLFGITKIKSNDDGGGTGDPHHGRDHEGDPARERSRQSADHLGRDQDRPRSEADPGPASPVPVSVVSPDKPYRNEICIPVMEKRGVKFLCSFSK